MKTQSENLTAHESLELISSMILQAKGDIQRNNFYFLLWGWVIVIANLAMYVLMVLGYHHAYAVWLVAVPAWIITLVKAFKSSKAQSNRSPFNKIVGWLWAGYGITVFLIVVFGYKLNYQINPLILTITAIPTFVCGMILRFKPLIVGGILFWIFGSAGFLVQMEYQPLIGAAAIICGYLIPGYLLKTQPNTAHV